MIVIFTGPTLAASDVPASPHVRLLPPAAQGDVYRVARERPWGIGIIDGYFEHVPAVWHKEILWAMTQGIHVFGAASMGALRAAELADFGMVGVGRIFEQYRDGELGADDEVAVAHLPSDHGHRRLSESLVDVRATLAFAVASEVCTDDLADRLVTYARAIFYMRRTWQRVLASARAAGEDPRALAALEAWLGTGRVEQKRRDGMELVEVMVAARRDNPAPLRVSYAFEHTDFWDRALLRMQEEGSAATEPGVTALLDELRLIGDEQLYTLAVQGALLRGLSNEVAARNGVRVDTELVRRTAVAFRRTHDLRTGELVSAWLDEQGLDPQTYFDMMACEARVRWTTAVSEPEMRRYLPDQLRAMNCHGRLHERARTKRAALERQDIRVADLLVDSDGMLWRWYFEDRLGRPVPPDLSAYAERFGFENTAALRAAVALERWYTESAS